MTCNRKKKTLYLLLCFVSTYCTSAFPAISANISSTAVEQRVSLLLQNVADTPTPQLVQDYLVAAGLGLLGAIIGHITSVAVLKVLGDRERTVRFLNLSDYDTIDYISTFGGAAFFASGTLCFSSLNFLSQQVNQPLLTIVLTESPDTLPVALSLFFVSHRFPRAAAFNELDILRKNLADIVAKLERAKGTPAYENIKPLLADLLTFLDAVRNAMITVKNDPRWLEECNAATLALAQANIQAQQNAQLANTVIQLAHQR